MCVCWVVVHVCSNQQTDQTASVFTGNSRCYIHHVVHKSLSFSVSLGVLGSMPNIRSCKSHCFAVGQHFLYLLCLPFTAVVQMVSKRFKMRYVGCCIHKAFLKF